MQFHGSGNIGHELPEGVAASYILDDDKTIRSEQCAYGPDARGTLGIKIKLPLIVTCSHMQVKLKNRYTQYGMK